jgi:hypothetical protein
MGFERIDGGWRYNFGGLKTNTAADEMPPTKYPFAKNVRYVKSLQTRPGYELLFNTVTPPPVGCSSLLLTDEAVTTPTAIWDVSVYAPELPLLLTLGNNGTTERAATSLNGATWSGTSLGILGMTAVGICWSPDLMIFCAVGSRNGGGTANAMTSANGTAWTQRPSAANFDWTSVCWSHDLLKFVAVGSDQSGSGLPQAMTSPDGITWTLQTYPGTFNQLPNAVIWISELNLFVAVGTDFDGTNQFVVTSPDGVTWTQRTCPANDNAWTALTYSPELNRIVAVGSSGSGTDNRTMHSTDSVTWVLGTVPAATPGNGDLTGIAWSASLALYIACGRDDGTGNFDGAFLHSNDGITFTIDTPPTNVTDPTSIFSFETETAVVCTGGHLDSTGAQVLITCADA